MRQHHQRQFIEEDESAFFEKTNKKEKHNGREKKNAKLYHKHREKGFTCVQCEFPVSAEREISGVNNRNHCPRCLFSRHVDEKTAGDRRATCMSRMEPVGLTLKQAHKRYGQEEQGELMLIHQCKGCGKISINRIAADDDAAFIYQLFKRTAETPAEWKFTLLAQGIKPLGPDDLTAVYSRLFGWQAILEEFEFHNDGEQTALAEHMDSELPLSEESYRGD